MHELSMVLDHVGVATHRLDAAQTTYERLGFTLTARSIHAGAVEPGGPVEPWGSGNHCAMFEQGYLELLGIVDPDLPSSAGAMLERYQGAHIVAFGCDNAADAYSILTKREPKTQPPAALERDAPFGPNDEETRRAKFQNIYLEPDVFPAAKLIFIEHQTVDVLWQPHLLEHPNTACQIAEVALCVEDVRRAADQLAELLGVDAETKGDGIAAIDVSRGRVYLLAPDVVPKWAKGVRPPAVPSVVGFGVGVRNLDTTKALLDAARVPYHQHPYPAIWLEPDHTLGPVLSFIQV
ncbi:MAG: VOC family protein [Pseudomonadota bacterium]